tara:strand:+ start:456 stop:653 length:198 start_codon:yes stop_codon:yes gene_type:complete
VTIDWGDIDLGKYNSPESWRQYAEVIADCTAAARLTRLQRDHDLTQTQLTLSRVAISFCAWLSRN